MKLLPETVPWSPSSESVASVSRTKRPRSSKSRAVSSTLLAGREHELRRNQLQVRRAPRVPAGSVEGARDATGFRSLLPMA